MLDYTTVPLSEVAKGTGCMLPLRFTGGCHRCIHVMRCPNDQAVEGRVKKLSAQLIRLDKLYIRKREQLYAARDELEKLDKKSRTKHSKQGE